MNLIVVKIDDEFGPKDGEQIKLNDIVTVEPRSWFRNSSHCLIKKNKKSFWYPRDCLNRISDYRDRLLDDLGI